MSALTPASPERAIRRRAPKIAVAVDLYDWHARDLCAAFARAGAVATPIRLAQCGFDSRRPHGLTIHRFGSGLPDGVFVRAIGSGSFESVTLRLSVLHALGDLGVPVANGARAIEICVDKAATTFALARAGLPTPPTWSVQSEEAARRIARRETPRGPLVLKPLFGAQGFGLRLIREEGDLPPLHAVEYVYYLQRFVGRPKRVYSDMRFFVSNGELIGAMTRRAAGWITNIKLGARPEWLQPDAATASLALRAAAAVGGQFAGVDMILDDFGAPQVLEVNSMPGWRGLQKVAPFAIADRLAADFLIHIGRPPVEKPAGAPVGRVA